MTDLSTLAQEWQLLQRDHERCESHALWLKIAAVVLCFISLAVVIDLLLVGLLIAILWVQEAIVRTAQDRLAKRLLDLEEAQRQAPGRQMVPFQLHSSWRANRGSALTLLAEYAVNAMRPTVVFPYAVLLLILLAALSTPPA